MRILYITRANLCLRRAHCHNILSTAEILSSIHDIQVTIVSSTHQTCSTDEIFSRHEIDPSFAFIYSRFLIGYIFLNKNKYDVVYIRDPRLILEMMIAKLLRKKIVFEIHGNREWRGLMWLWILAHSVADVHIYITAALKNYYGASSKPSAVIVPVGINLKKFDKTVPKSKHSDGIFTVLYLGSQEIYYNVSLLIQMLKYLPDNIKLLLVGMSGGGAEILAEFARKMNVYERVEITQRVNYPVVPSYLKGADILLNPKIKGYEGSISSKLIEYLASGRPIVASTTDADLEILNKNNAIIVKPKAEEFAKAVSKLIHDPVLRDSLAARARKDAEQFSLDVRKKLFEGIISKI